MGRYNTPVKDWTVKLRSKDFPQKGKRKFGERTLQQGTTSFGRKSKNACKLASTGEIRRREDASIDRDQNRLNCARAFPKINLKNSAATPRIVVVVKAPPPTPAEPKRERVALNTFQWG